MGKPKKEKKSHAKSQLEYEERQKKILGKERYLAKRAKQRAASRARCWARFTEDDKEAKRANQRLRAYKYRHPQANNVTEESETSRADAMLVDAPNKVQAEHVHSTPVTSDLDPSSHKVKFQINDFVAAVYANSWYIGKIVGYMRDEDNDLFYNIDFMKTTSTIPPKFCWPDRKDELPVPYEDILMVIPSPSLTGTSRRQMYHTLEENILVSVEEKFQNFTEASA